MTKELQEETYQNLENKAVEELDKIIDKDCYKSPNEKYNNLADFLKSHLQLAYKAGEEKGAQEEKDMTELFEDKKGDREGIRQQAITSERERIRKWAEKEWKYSFDWDTEVILIDDLLQELQNK